MINRTVSLARIVCVTLLMVSPAGSRACASDVPSGEGTIHFVAIADTHHGKPVHDYRFRQAVEAINALPFDIQVVAHLGDFASDNLHREETGVLVSNMLARIEKPVIAVAGNHDLSMRGQDPKQRLLDSLAVYRAYIGELGQVHETDDAVFIAVTTEHVYREMPDVLDFNALDWLREHIQRAGSKPVFVFTHVPDGPDFYNNTLHPGWPEPAREAWRTVLRSGNVKGVFAGHFHRDELQQNDDGIPTFVTSSIADFWGRQASFKIYTYENGRISYRTVYIEDPPPGAWIFRDGTLGERPALQ